MKNISRLLLLLAFAALSSLQAQESTCSFLDYDFNPNASIVPEQFKNEGEIVLDKTVKIEVITNPKAVEEYLLSHEIIYVNSDEGIQRNNRIYISYGENSKIITLKNRVILKDGTVIELNKNDIHEETDQKTGQKYSYFAVRGLEMGAVIEKIQIIQNNPYFTDRRFDFQGSAPIAKYNFQLISPKHLIWECKSYNGLPAYTKKDSLLADKSVIEVEATNLPIINTVDKMANHDIFVQSFRFKLFENTFTGGRNFYNYNEFAQEFSNNVNTQITNDELKAAQKFFGSLKLTGKEPDLPYLIEHHIKSSISYNNNFSQNKNLNDVIKNKQGNSFDLLILYGAAFKNLGVKKEYVFTTNRYKWPFDKNFETTGQLDEFMFYLPDYNQYIDITNNLTRTPLFDYSFGSNDGLFISEIQYKNLSKAVTNVKRIELPDMYATTDSMFIHVDFSENIDQPKVTSKIQLGGYSGIQYQPIKDFVDEKRYLDILKDIAKSYSADVEDVIVTDKNGGLKYVGKERFEINVIAKVPELLQNAGNKYLFKLGELIGAQTEIYQEEERQLPGDMPYPHYYYRILKVTLPEGYTLSNPEAGVYDFKTVIENDTVAEFVSKYTLDGNLYTIENIEYYKQTYTPLTHFESLRKVLNAAADFNKLVIVLEKK